MRNLEESPSVEYAETGGAASARDADHLARPVSIENGKALIESTCLTVQL